MSLSEAGTTADCNGIVPMGQIVDGINAEQEIMYSRRLLGAQRPEPPPPPVY